MVSAEKPSTLSAVHGRRQDLEEMLGQVERAIAAPTPGRFPEWVRGVRSELFRLRGSLACHVEVTEGPEGLHEEITRRAPRLGQMVARLQEEHTAIRRRIDENLAFLALPAQDDPRRVAAIREAVRATLGLLARHRQLGADLIYEAYSVDIGSVD